VAIDGYYKELYLNQLSETSASNWKQQTPPFKTQKITSNKKKWHN
jgi:hypothetical protein